MDLVRSRRALVSVSDKRGVVDLARRLASHGIELISTGGTHRLLSQSGLTVREIAEVTGFPEILDGRVKTLHPAIHGGILMRRELDEDQKTCDALGIHPIDIIVVNLYPFESTIAAPGTSLQEAVEQIDIGGPSMIRSAAKNHAWTAVVTDPSQYDELVRELSDRNGCTSLAFRQRLACRAFQRTSDYDQAIAKYLMKIGFHDQANEFPDSLRLSYEKRFNLRYGENPHQAAAAYLERTADFACVIRGETLHGKELSYNNLVDLDSALRLVREFAVPAAAVIKHNNPCGCGVGTTLAKACELAISGDPVSAYGGIVGLNRTVDVETALKLSEPGSFIEAIVAPAFDMDAIECLTTRPSWKTSVRLVQVGPLDRNETQRRLMRAIRQIEGGLLCQNPDFDVERIADARIVTEVKPTKELLEDLQFAWTVVKHVGSNAIVLAKNGMIVGVGAGQMSRVESVRIALEKAGDRGKGAVMASDAFFPFRDGIDLALAAGVSGVVQPGGSRRDQDSIQACNEKNTPMVFTGVRHFRH